MSGRTTKWVMLVVLPLLLALYLSYPPVSVPLVRRQVEVRIARTVEEAQEHQVKVGEQYEVAGPVLWRRWLPLAIGQREERSRLIERREDGTIVEERTLWLEGRVKLGLDVAGGTELLYELKPGEGERIGGNLANTIGILKDRIDPSNVKEFRIQPLESNRILIQVPRATAAEVEQLKRRLQTMGKLEFKLAAPREGKHTRWYEEAEQGTLPDGYVTMHVNKDASEPFHLVRKGDPAITGQYLIPRSLLPTMDEYGLPAVAFEFDTMGARKFARITEDNLGWDLAIILDGVLKSAPRIQERIPGAGRITGRFTQDEVNDIVNVLRAGSLPMDIELLQESSVGPQVGRDSIRMGLWALAVAGFLVLVFIGVYYAGCGLIADAALILNLVFLVGVLSFLGAALTLPGMAGILLTVGMAVDANVLIFERIREETAAGKGVRVALRNGYNRAFTTIVDANVTTLLTAIILYLVGTGPVRGFAVTLSFGILLSMFTALVLTRLAFETMIEKGWLQQFRIRSLIGRSTIGFSRIRKPAYVISTVVVVVGLVAFFGRGGDLYDIDFTGGSLLQLSLARPTPVSEVRSLLAKAGFADAQVQGVQAAAAAAASPEGARSEGLTDFGVRIKGAGVERVKDTVLPAAEQKLAAAGLLKEEYSLEATIDGRGLVLTLKEPAGEMEIRYALAEGGDPYELGSVRTVVPAADVLASRFTVRVYNVSSLIEHRELWGKMLRTLTWAGLKTNDYAIQKCALQDAASSESGPAGLEMVLDRPLQWQLLATELDRRQFPQLRVQPAEEEGTSFVLMGERDVLERFQREFPAGATFQSVPIARIDGLTITVSLASDFSEQDIRAKFERQGMPDVCVVPDVKSRVYRLNLSYEPIRRKMQDIFANLARRSVDVSFGGLRGPGGAQGIVKVDMELDPPLTLSVMKHYIEGAGIGPYAEGLIEAEEDYGPGTQISKLTLTMPRGKADEIQRKIQESFGEPQPVQSIVSIGSTVAEEMQGRALMAVVFASVIIVLYVAVRFHALRFGLAAVIALVHDIVITAGLIALADWSGLMGDVKVNMAMLAAFLTVLGYSLNDTIVVFDRIRENMANLGRKSVDAELIDLSINQTLSRTILTSLTTLTVVVVLYLLGGPVLQGLALTLIFGVIVGTYSSMFIASPILLDWAVVTRTTMTFFRILFLPVTLPFKAASLLLGGGR